MQHSHRQNDTKVAVVVQIRDHTYLEGTTPHSLLENAANSTHFSNPCQDEVQVPLNGSFVNPANRPCTLARMMLVAPLLKDRYVLPSAVAQAMGKRLVKETRARKYRKNHGDEFDGAVPLWLNF